MFRRFFPFLKRRFVNPISVQLTQGTEPSTLAWSVALGSALGLFPILGTTTLICGVVGGVFRLNHVAMQSMNYLVYGAHLFLIPVFIRVGEKISGATPIVVDLQQMKTHFADNPSLFFQDFGLAAWHGVLAWAVIMPIPTWFFALFLRRVFAD